LQPSYFSITLITVTKKAIEVVDKNVTIAEKSYIGG
jgi:hypothetical protein